MSHRSDGHSDFFDGFYKAFESKFRGSRELIKGRLVVYAPFLLATRELQTPARAIDLGCGRGEWLELLRESGFEALGVDLSEGMLADCRELGLNVRQEDALAALGSLPAESQSIVSGFHIAEHLAFDDLLLLVREALRVLLPGGLLILETPNPDNIRVATNSFYFDPTHRNPLPSELLSFASEYCGFARSKVLRFHEDSEIGKVSLRAEMLLGGVSRDYAVVAQKRADEHTMSQVNRAFEAEHGVTFDQLVAWRKQQDDEKSKVQSEEISQLQLRWKEHRLQLEQTSEALCGARAGLETEVTDLRNVKADLRDTSSLVRDATTGLKDAMAGLQDATAGLRAAEARLLTEAARKDHDHGRQIAHLTSQFQRAAAANAELQQQIDLFRGSTSWRVTAPLRWIARAVRFRRPQKPPGSAPAAVAPAPSAEAHRPSRVDAAPADVGAMPAARQGQTDPLAFEPRFVRLALQRLEAFRRVETPRPAEASKTRPRLAYFSPLPPQQSGISDYSAELLPALALYYDIDAIVEDTSCVAPNSELACNIQNVDWFERHVGVYDRILYHVGNSPFHSYMFPLIERYPGAVVLHDFHLGNIFHHLEYHGWAGYWTNALLYAHGHTSLLERYADGAAAAHKYPANRHILEDAQGIIVHSEHARSLARNFYRDDYSSNWVVIPSLRKLPASVDRSAARRELGVSEDDYLVCSFGMVGPTKLNLLLLKAWLASSLCGDKACHLIFVGEAPENSYSTDLRHAIASASAAGRIVLTEFAPRELYEKYLSAADVAVQLRMHSRGETSAAVRDCMGYGLPVVVNAHGSSAELPREAVVMLQEELQISDLVDALERLRSDADSRVKIGSMARDYTALHWSPFSVAQRYFHAIEGFAGSASALFDAKTLIERAEVFGDRARLPAAGLELVRESRVRPALRQLLVDVSVVARDDFKTGIQRVVRSQLMELLKSPPQGFEVTPVRLTDQRGTWEYICACEYTSRLFGLPPCAARDQLVEVFEGDILLVSDFNSGAVVAAERQGLYSEWRSRGVEVNFVVYDILPLSMPQHFPPYAESAHAEWLEHIAECADRLICISGAVADEVRGWLSRNKASALTHLKIASVHLGADIDASAPSGGLPAEAASILSQIHSRPTFLMVGTVEPRKGYSQALAAFHALWHKGVDVNLVIAGSEGWVGLPEQDRRTIPNIVNAIRHSSELGKRLIWLQQISDEYLKEVYDASTCLLAASEDEGFGLPLVEAARHDLPILARDIPVFREVGGRHLAYFGGIGEADLANALEEWMARYAEGTHAKSAGLRWLTWAESVERLKTILAGANDEF